MSATYKLGHKKLAHLGYYISGKAALLRDPMTTVSLALFHVFLIFQPCTKRARQELPFEEQYRSIFQAAARALETTEFLLKHSNVPAWLLPELEALQERIETLKCCVLIG